MKGAKELPDVGKDVHPHPSTVLTTLIPASVFTAFSRPTSHEKFPAGVKLLHLSSQLCPAPPASHPASTNGREHAATQTIAAARAASASIEDNIVALSTLHGATHQIAAKSATVAAGSRRAEDTIVMGLVHCCTRSRLPGARRWARPSSVSFPKQHTHPNKVGRFADS